MFKKVLRLDHPVQWPPSPSRHDRPTPALVASILIFAIGALALIGWSIDNQLLKAFLPEQRPINPMAAVGLINLSLVFLAYYFRFIWVHRLLGLLSIALGIAALLPLSIDTILFANKVLSSGAHTAIADTAAVCFICAGVAALLSASWKLPLRIIGNASVGIILIISVANMLGQIYAHDLVYGISGNFVMAFNLALAFIIAVIAGILLVLRKHRLSGLSDISLLGWLLIAAFVVMQIGGYLYWLQLHNNDKADAMKVFVEQSEALKRSVDTQVIAYTNALHGFDGLYSASDFVSQRDFAAYYNSLKLEQNYPGLRSLAFIASVKTADIPAMVRAYRADRSLFPQGNPTYTIRTQGTTPVHFYTLYLSSYGELFTTYSGIDIATIPGRYDSYMYALSNDTAYASGPVTFLAQSNQAAETGFYIIIPVQEDDSDTPIGVVNANFSYHTFFTSIFGDSLKKNDLNIKITDAGTTLYQSSGYQGDTTFRRSMTIPILGRSWTMSVAAGSNYGVTGEQSRTQRSFLLSLLILSTMLVLMFLIQSRTRSRAISLANSMTANIRRERRRTLEAKEKDEAILSSIGDGLIAFDKTGKINLNNSTAERLLGVGPGELIGKKFSEFSASRTLDGKLLPISLRPYQRVLQSGKPLSTKLYYRRSDGSRFPSELNVAPIIRGGKLVGAIEVFRDITADVQLDRAKSEFVSLASHQLRTPLSAINWYAEMLLNGDGGKLTDEQQQYVREIFEGNQRMVELVNSLLDVSRLELGRMAFDAEPVVLSKMIAELEDELRVTIDTKHMKLTRLIDTVPEITTDRKMARMIIQNLMSNALKYTGDGGHVTIALGRPNASDLAKTKLKPTGDYVLLRVSDTGYGIPEVQQKRIFEKMFRADNVQVLDVEGTGLGLYIVKAVTKQMGGWIGFESKEGEGTAFTVILPVTPPASSVKAPHS